MGMWRSAPVASPKARPTADLRANASAALAAVLFGASVVAVRVAVRHVPPVSLAVLRFGQGGLLLAVLLLVVAPGRLLVRWERLRLFALLGLVLFALFPLTFNLTPTQVAVYVNLNPIVAALLAILLLGERRSGLFLVGFAAVVAGVLLVNWPARRS